MDKNVNFVSMIAKESKTKRQLEILFLTQLLTASYKKFYNAIGQIKRLKNMSISLMNSKQQVLYIFLDKKTL